MRLGAISPVWGRRGKSGIGAGEGREIAGAIGRCGDRAGIRG